jgi:hypothetical protein
VACLDREAGRAHQGVFWGIAPVVLRIRSRPTRRHPRSIVSEVQSPPGWSCTSVTVEDKMCAAALPTAAVGNAAAKSYGYSLALSLFHVDHTLWPCTCPAKHTNAHARKHTSCTHTHSHSRRNVVLLSGGGPSIAHAPHPLLSRAPACRPRDKDYWLCAAVTRHVHLPRVAHRCLGKHQHSARIMCATRRQVV